MEELQPESGVDPRRIWHTCLFHVVPWLFLTGLFTYLDRSNLSFASFAFNSDLHLDNSKYGLGAGIFFLGYAISQVPSNYICCKVGAHLWLPALLVAWGTVSAATAAVTNQWQFFVLRFFLGAAEAGTFPGAWYHLSTFFLPSEMAVAYSWTTSSANIAQVIGAPMAAGLLMLDGKGGLHGWQHLFLIEGILTAAFGICLKWVLPASPNSARFLTETERKWLAARQSQLCAQAAAADPRSVGFSAVLRRWQIWYLGCCWAMVTCTTFAIIFWTPLLLDGMFNGTFTGTPAPHAVLARNEQAWHTAKLALMSSAVFIPTVFSMLLIAYSSKRHDERRLHCCIPLTVGGVAFMLLPLVLQKGGPRIGFLGLAFAATAVWGVTGPIWSWPAVFLQGAAGASGIAVFNTFGALGGFAGPYLLGSLSATRGYSGCMIVLGAINLLAAVLLYVFP